MRTFSWKYFTLSGDVDAYLFYKDMQHQYYDNTDYEDDSTDEEDVRESGNYF